MPIELIYILATQHTYNIVAIFEKSTTCYGYMCLNQFNFKFLFLFLFSDVKLVHFAVRQYLQFKKYFYRRFNEYELEKLKHFARSSDKTNDFHFRECNA